MRGGTAVQVSVASPKYAGETLPTWISEIKGQPSVLDASATVHMDANGAQSIRIAVVNRSETESFCIPLRIAFEGAGLQDTEVEVHELWHPEVNAKNGWGKENEISIRTSRARWSGEWTFREHSFTLLVLDSKQT